MEALYDQRGRVYAWLALDTGRIYDLNGRNLAFLHNDSVYDWQGRHIAWWLDGHIRDRTGAVALFTADAQRLGVIKPLRALKPLKPLKALAPLRPTRQLKPLRPIKRLCWTNEMPF